MAHHLFCSSPYISMYFRNSCGLFVIECLEHWDGDRMTGLFSQVSFLPMLVPHHESYTNLKSTNKFVQYIAGNC
jgi:hypothetical protein